MKAAYLKTAECWNIQEKRNEYHWHDVITQMFPPFRNTNVYSILKKICTVFISYYLTFFCLMYCTYCMRWSYCKMAFTSQRYNHQNRSAKRYMSKYVHVFPYICKYFWNSMEIYKWLDFQIESEIGYYLPLSIPSACPHDKELHSKNIVSTMHKTVSNWLNATDRIFLRNRIVSDIELPMNPKIAIVVMATPPTHHFQSKYS